MAIYPPPGIGLTTNEDRELKPLTEKVKAGEMARRRSGLTGELSENAQPAVRGIAWKFFQRRHKEWRGDYWRQCRAFYAGGPDLLEDKELMRRVFPPHANENPQVYDERCRRAFYFAYAGTIVDNLVGGLLEDPVNVAPPTGSSRDSKLSEPLRAFTESLGPPHALGEELSFSLLLLQVIREALLVRCAWVLMDLPHSGEDVTEDMSLLDQEHLGLLRPYCLLVEAEWVINWQVDRMGELEWAVLCDREFRQDTLEGDPYIRDTYTIYDRQGWQRYQIDYQEGKEPRDDVIVPLVDEGVHDVDIVPMVRLKLPAGLWAMGKLESLSREHFNKRAAVSWAEFKSLFSMLYEFLAPEAGATMIPKVSAAQQDPDRAVSQVRGQGYSQVRGHEDRAEFIGPPVGPFSEGRASCNEVMQEMHRVLYSMALSADMSNAALRRSGESKKSDDAKIAIILLALGDHMQKLGRSLVLLWQRFTGSTEDFAIRGGREFNATDVQVAIENAVQLMNGVPQKSPTFTKAFLLKLYRLVLGEELEEEEWEEVRKELDEAITMEDQMLEAAAMVDQAAPADDDGDEDGAPAQNTPRRMFASGPM